MIYEVATIATTTTTSPSPNETYTGHCVLQEVLDELKLWDETMHEAAKDVKQQLNLHRVVSEKKSQLQTILGFQV